MNRTSIRSASLWTLLSPLALLLILSACTGGAGTHNDAENDSDSIADSLAIQTSLSPEREINGTVGDGTSMNVLELVTDSLDTLYIETSNIVVSGGLVCGHRVNVVYHKDEEGLTASSATNTTALEHLWTRRTETGQTQSLEINANGRAATYDMPAAYAAWRLHGGRLLLSARKRVGTEQAGYTDTFDIMMLNTDSLVLAGNHGMLHYWREN